MIVKRLLSFISQMFMPMLCTKIVEGVLPQYLAYFKERHFSVFSLGCGP